MTDCGAREMVVARGLTVLIAGVKKCADNNSEQSNKRSREAAQRAGTQGNIGG
jgi:hypothetical protein